MKPSATFIAMVAGTVFSCSQQGGGVVAVNSRVWRHADGGVLLLAAGSCRNYGLTNDNSDSLTVGEDLLVKDSWNGEELLVRIVNGGQEILQKKLTRAQLASGSRIRDDVMSASGHVFSVVHWGGDCSVPIRPDEDSGISD